MKTDDYKRGAEDALEWVKENADTAPDDLTYLKRAFWHDQEQLTDDDRYEAFLKGADDYMGCLRRVLLEREESCPDRFMYDAIWMRDYLAYA